MIWVQHSDDHLVEGSDEWQYVDELERDDAEPLVHKHYGDSFEDTDLEALLQARKVGHLVVAGASTDACIRSTLHGALVRGYDTTLVADAHTTEDPSNWGLPLDAQQVIAFTNAYWSDSGAPGRAAATVATADVDLGLARPRRPPLGIASGRVTVMGSAVDPDVGHRRFLDVGPGLRPLGDDRAVRPHRADRPASTGSWTPSTTASRPMPSSDRSSAGISRTAASGRSGSSPNGSADRPATASRPGGALYQHHEDVPITPAIAERWLEHLRGSLHDAVPAEARRGRDPRTGPGHGAPPRQLRGRVSRTAARTGRDTARRRSPPVASAPAP